MRRWLAAVLLTVAALAARAGDADASTIRGIVYDDANGDGVLSAGERGHAGAVVAFDDTTFAVAGSDGRFELDVVDGRAPCPAGSAADGRCGSIDGSDGPVAGIVWVRAPEGYAPGPIWQLWDGTNEIELGLRALPAPVVQPFAFVVASDTHLSARQTYFGADDLRAVAREATALAPPPAFFTILGDITQGNRDEDFDGVEAALAGLGVPWVPVPGNHDWWDGGLTWFRRMGPDNYSFDLGGVHFVVWNMARPDDEVRQYLGAELALVAPGTPIVALTHAPPSEAVVDVLRDLHVGYVLTGHTHVNRVVDHGGLVELGTEPLLMGGLDFSPAGYRVVTVDGGKLSSYHRTVVDAPSVRIESLNECDGGSDSTIAVAVELTAAPNDVGARVDCGEPIRLRPRGGWIWSAPLPQLAPGVHVVDALASNRAGQRVHAEQILTCGRAPARPAAGADWPGLGGGADHRGARDAPLPPPLAERWAAPLGGLGLQAAPAIADGLVVVVGVDQGDGATGGVAALDLATGAVRWRVTAPKPVRGGAAIANHTVVVQMIDGVALGLDLATGAERWRRALGKGAPIAARTTLGTPTPDGSDVAIGNQHELAFVDAATGSARWTDEPVLAGIDTESLAGVAVGDGLAVGAFDRGVGGVIAYDRATGARRWQALPPIAIAVNASPVIADGRVMFASGDDSVTAISTDANRPRLLWRTSLDQAGFEWGYAIAGTPAYARGLLIVPTLYRDLVALDAATGAVRWRAGALAPSPLRTTHYRGKGQVGFEAAPVIAGDLVWAADTAGNLVARDLATGAERGRYALGAPVLAGLAPSGDYLIAVTYDGVVHALASAPGLRLAEPAAGCVAASPPPESEPPVAVAALLGAIAVLAFAGAAGPPLWRRLRNR